MDEEIKIPSGGIALYLEELGQNEVQTVRIDLIDDFPDHPYPVLEDEALVELAKSISQNGQLEPAIVRAVGNGRYQMLSGHRRKLANIKLANDEMRAIVLENLTDDQAKAIMLNCNVRRAELLPTEKARIYYEKKMLYQNMDKAELFDLAAVFGSLDHSATAILSKSSEESEGQIKRYIRLHMRASDTLKSMVDSGEISLRLADELTAFPYNAQNIICDILQEYKRHISYEEIGKLRQLDNISRETVLPVLGLVSSPVESKPRLRLSVKKIRSYFPDDYAPEQIEKILYGLLEEWKANN